MFLTMTINVEIQKTGSESNASVLRRFTKKVQSAGILPRVRGIRYKSRKLSPYKKKMQALRSIERRTEVDRLIKLGKLTENRKK
jgi:ribosomal protein S21